MIRKSLIVLFLISLFATANAQQQLQIAVLKYKGGGDWYANPTSLPNLAKFCNRELGTNISENIATVETQSNELFLYPFIHMTGHGNVVFTNEDAENIRKYLIGGGFLHIDDNYGMDEFIRLQMKKVFPELEFIELPFTHPIYHQKYNFSKGLPKVHQHDNKPAQGFGLIYEGRLICFYSYECDLGDGWEDSEVHNDSEQTRRKALEMGANIVQFSFHKDDSKSNTTPKK